MSRVDSRGSQSLKPVWSTLLRICALLGTGLISTSCMTAICPQGSTCQVGAALIPVPSPLNPTVGTPGATSVMITNSSSTVPQGTNVAVNLAGDVFLKLACADASCTTARPGILTFLNCTNQDPQVASCVLDPADPSGNTVKITTKPTPGILIAAGELNHQIATVNWQAPGPVTACSEPFFQEARTNGLVMATITGNTTGTITGSATGTAALSCPR